MSTICIVPGDPLHRPRHLRLPPSGVDPPHPPLGAQITEVGQQRNPHLQEAERLQELRGWVTRVLVAAERALTGVIGAMGAIPSGVVESVKSLDRFLPVLTSARKEV